MKKKLLLLSLIVLGIILYPKNTYAFSSEDYKNKSLCGTYEVAGMHADGVIDPVACFSVFEDAQAWMKNNGAEDLVIFHRLNGKTVILDANMALVDLSVHSGTLNFYTTKESSDAYTYMNNESTYGGGDGAFIEAAYSNLRQIFMAKVKIANFTGWIAVDNYEIVPITWVKSSSSYTVTEESIRHNYVTRVQDPYGGNAGSTIGPKPDMLSTGTYYSYDGHFFYKDRKTMLKDYKNNTHNNAVNKNDEYYNYYMYLSNHTRTNYSSQNIDEYIRNNMGYYRDVFGNSASSGASRLYGKGQFFYYVQEKYGANAVLALSLSRNETGNGRSNLAINNNNGFGLNAVDSNPNNGKSWYPSFTYSIAKYGSHWITHKYADVKEWQYFGPQFGNKGIGMNVKYASDPYWSEKMAANYYSLDKSKGLQDYNYYQLGVLKQGAVIARSDASNSAKEVYKYPEAEDAVVIVGEKEGETVNGDATWYEVVSDLNLDSNYNEKGEGEAYNWDMTVYVPAAYIKKINKGKNGYVSPNSVTKYQDSEYEYDLYVEEADVKPKVAKSVKETSFYYDSALTTKKDQKLVNNRYVMVYSAAYDKNGVAVSYLVTSDYWYDQKEWVPADSITFVTSDYGKFSVTASGNQYTWVNSNTEDIEETKISGHYTNSYAPILEEKVVNGQTWYKVPVDISGTTDEFGWTLASAPNVYVEKRNAKAANTAPVIIAEDKTIVQGTKFDYKAGVTATDNEDGPLTDKIEVVEETVKIDVVGSYQVTYKVTDKNNATTTKTITVTVTENQKPVINAEDKEVIQYRELDELDGVSATDEEDGKVEVKVKNSTVKLDEAGTYEITYEATDTYKQTTEKTIKVTVIKDEAPVINAEDKTITQGTKFKPLEGVTAEDKEEGEIKDIEVVKNDVNEKVIDTYEVTYKAVDSYKNETTKTIKVTVVENQKPVINAEDKTIYLNEEFDELDGVTAEDPEDGKIEKIEVIKNDVKTDEVGTYKVIYRVEDTFGNVVEKEITVTVEEKKLEEKSGEFYLESLEWNNDDKKFTVSGYLIIYDINNENKEYEVVFKDKNSDKEYTVKVNSWIKDTPYDLGKVNGNSYSNSWFKGTLDMTDIPNGDYELYMKATNDKYYTEQIFDNLFNVTIDKRGEDNVHGYNFKVLQNYKSQKMEINIREELYTTSQAPTYRDMINGYEQIEFQDNKLYIQGYSYNYAGTYDNPDNIKRVLILENQKDYSQKYIDLGCTKGPYEITSLDDKSKKYVWYEKAVNIENLEKGTYTLQVYTKTRDAEDYGDLNDLFGILETKKTTIGNKTYQIQINKDRENRVELIVE
jgi:hypothetical protein